jgi:lipopolysaccharide transport system ATP-binding protein
MEHGTVLFVSHDSGAVINLCRRALWLDKGVVKAIGSPKEIADRYLANLVESRQGVSTVPPMPSSRLSDRSEGKTATDQRLRYLNSSAFRNDIELFDFNPHAPAFGLGGARIVEVQLHDAEGAPLAWCVGGESVTLRIRCLAHQDLFSPIVGFFFKDRLGQVLFGDNTYLSNINSPLEIKSGGNFEATFVFRMPILPVGDYSISAAVAEGAQAEHVQHHWIHDALFIKSHSTSVSTGLVGIPITQIELYMLS